jgi:serine/threonine protein kinase
VRPDGAVKVSDFGLAKALEPSAATVAEMTASPTITSPAMTRMGVILGTAAYMSPEQARGKPVDKRADIWAFGSVLFEMLTGRPPFGGETVADVLASVVKEEPRWTDVPADTPPGIRKLIARCLQKDPLRRLQAIGEARIAIEEAAREPLIDQPPIGPGVSRRAERIGWIAALVVISAIAWPQYLAPFGPSDPCWRSPRLTSKLRRRGRRIRDRSRFHPMAERSCLRRALKADHSCGCVRSIRGPHARWQGPSSDRCRSGRQTASPSASLLMAS